MSRTLRLVLYSTLLALAAVGVVVGALFLLRPARALAGTALNQPVEVAGLQLVDHTGATVDLAADFRGDVTLVFFGYTRCPDVCPLTMARLARAYQQLDRPDGLRVVMVTVDPGHDTPEVLGDYVRRFDPDFVGLTGSNSQVAEAARTFFVGFAGNAPAVSHTDTVAVLDREGRMRYLYGQEAVLKIEEDLPGLLRTL